MNAKEERSQPKVEDHQNDGQKAHFDSALGVIDTFCGEAHRATMIGRQDGLTAPQ